MYFYSAFVFLLIIRFESTSSNSWTIRTDYTQVDQGVDYVPANGNLGLGCFWDVKLVQECAFHCMVNDECLTATYNSQLSQCTLFSENSLLGRAVFNLHTSVIGLIDRSKNKHMISLTVFSKFMHRKNSERSLSIKICPSAC